MSKLLFENDNQYFSIFVLNFPPTFVDRFQTKINSGFTRFTGFSGFLPGFFDFSRRIGPDASWHDRDLVTHAPLY